MRARFVAELRGLGLQVKMLTGDALAVASEIAQGVGLANIRRVADLKAAGAGDEAVRLLASADGFAEVYPEDKYIVVQRLQAAGHVTGMTGDGVNDAPALRQAEVGIAVSSAHRRRQGRGERRAHRAGAHQHRDAGRAGADDLPAHPHVDREQGEPHDPQGGLRLDRVPRDGQVRRVRLRHAAARLHDGLREDRARDRQRPAVAPAGDLGNRGIRRRLGGIGRRHGRGSAPAPARVLVALRPVGERPRAALLQLPRAALPRRVLHRVGPRAAAVLGVDARQGARGRPRGRSAGGHPHRGSWGSRGSRRCRGGRRWRYSRMRRSPASS